MSLSKDLISKWKNAFVTSNNQLHLNVLGEIITVIEQTKDEEERGKIYKILVNSDICHFICLLLSFKSNIKLEYINKVMCLLAESEYFYKHEIYRVAKCYLRIMNTLPTARGSAYNKTADDIFKCVAIILISAYQRNVNFLHEKISLIQIVATAKNISNTYTNYKSALQFINICLKIIAPYNEAGSEKEKEYRNGFVVIIIKNIIIRQEMLSDISYFILITKLIQSYFNVIPYSATTPKDDKIICELATDRILEVMEFVLTTTPQLNITFYENFCNLIYQALTSHLIPSCKKLILNYLFRLNGHNFLLDEISKKDTQLIVKLKFQLLLAQVLAHLSKFLQNLTDEDLTTNDLEEKYADLVINSQKFDIAGKILKMIMIYIDTKWNLSMMKKDVTFEAVSQLVYEMIKNDEQVLFKFDKGFLMMMLSSYISYFTPQKISIKKDDLALTSFLVAKMHNRLKIKLELDFSFFKWWTTQHSVDRSKKQYEELFAEFIRQKSSCFYVVCEEDAKLFDSKLLVKNFLEKHKKKTPRNNLLSILLNSHLTDSDIAKLLQVYKKGKNQTLAVYELTQVFKNNSARINLRTVKGIGNITTKFLETKSIDINTRSGYLDIISATVQKIITKDD